MLDIMNFIKSKFPLLLTPSFSQTIFGKPESTFHQNSLSIYHLPWEESLTYPELLWSEAPFSDKCKKPHH